MRPKTPITVLLLAICAVTSCSGTRTLTIESRTAGTERSAALTNIWSLAIYIDGSNHGADTIPPVIRLKVGASLRLKAEALDSDGKVLPANPVWRPQFINKLRVSPNIGSHVTLTALEAIDTTYVEVTQAGIYARFTVSIFKQND